MTEDLLLIGPLADPMMLKALALTGAPAQIKGRLRGGAHAGILADAWPSLEPAETGLAAIRVTPNAALSRYAAVMGLLPLHCPEGLVLGITHVPPSAAEKASAEWNAGLAARIARLIVESAPDLTPEALARRLPMLGIWASSQIRAAASSPSGGDLVARRGPDDVRLSDCAQPHAGYFAVESAMLSHRNHEGGGFTPTAKREAFVMGDAVAVLPWDPRRDRVLVVEQFRFAPALRMDPQPWQLEPVAGRVDAGERVEDAARREALEEANLTLTTLFPTVHNYPSPGAVTEYLYLYVGIADLPDGSAGIHGLDDEAEDIRGHLVDRETLFQMVLAGQISNGPLALLSLWLQSQYSRLIAELSESAMN